MSVGDVAQVVAAAAAAVAAFAAWRSTAISARTLQRSMEPLLVAQPLVVRQQQIHLEVHNGGGGIALTSAFIVVTDTEKAAGYLGLGTLKPGEHVRVRTTLRPPPHSINVRGIVVCRDAAGAVWAWQMGGVDRREIARLVDISGEEPRGDTIFAQYFPEIDLGQLHPVACDVLTPAELEKARSESTERLRDLPI
jgi:hypothetical protein